MIETFCQICNIVLPVLCFNFSKPGIMSSTCTLQNMLLLNIFVSQSCQCVNGYLYRVELLMSTVNMITNEFYNNNERIFGIPKKSVYANSNVLIIAVLYLTTTVRPLTIEWNRKHLIPPSTGFGKTIPKMYWVDFVRYNTTKSGLFKETYLEAVHI